MTVGVSEGVSRTPSLPSLEPTQFRGGPIHELVPGKAGVENTNITGLTDP